MVTHWVRVVKADDLKEGIGDLLAILQNNGQNWQEAGEAAIKYLNGWLSEL